MVDIQSPTAENRRGKKQERRRTRKIVTTAAKYNGLPITMVWAPLDTGNKYPALHRRFRKTSADYLFAVCHCHLSRHILSDSFLLRNNEMCYHNFSVHYCCK